MFGLPGSSSAAVPPGNYYPGTSRESLSWCIQGISIPAVQDQPQHTLSLALPVDGNWGQWGEKKGLRDMRGEYFKKRQCVRGCEGGRCSPRWGGREYVVTQTQIDRKWDFNSSAAHVASCLVNIIITAAHISLSAELTFGKKVTKTVICIYTYILVCI